MRWTFPRKEKVCLIFCKRKRKGAGLRVQSTDGIVEHNVEYTLDNFATLSTHGTSDSVILDLMLNKHLPETE